MCKVFCIHTDCLEWKNANFLLTEIFTSCAAALSNLRYNLQFYTQYCTNTTFFFFLFQVFGHQNNPARLVKCPKVVITSYTMLSRLRKSMSQQDWAVLIVDESHQVRCSKQISESDEVMKSVWIFYDVEVILVYLSVSCMTTNNLPKYLEYQAWYIVHSFSFYSIEIGRDIKGKYSKKLFF